MGCNSPKSDERSLCPGHSRGTRRSNRARCRRTTGATADDAAQYVMFPGVWCKTVQDLRTKMTKDMTQDTTQDTNDRKHARPELPASAHFRVEIFWSLRDFNHAHRFFLFTVERVSSLRKTKSAKLACNVKLCETIINLAWAFLQSSLDQRFPRSRH